MLTGNNSASHLFGGSILTDNFRGAFRDGSQASLELPEHIRKFHTSNAEKLRRSTLRQDAGAETVIMVLPDKTVRGQPYPQVGGSARTASGETITVSRTLRRIIQGRPERLRGIGIAASPDAFEIEEPPQCLATERVMLPNKADPQLGRAFYNHLVHDVVQITPTVVDGTPNSRSRLDNPRSSAGIAAHLLVSGMGCSGVTQRGAATGPISYDIDAPSWIVSALSCASFIKDDANKIATLREYAYGCSGSDAELLFAYVATFGFTCRSYKSAGQIVVESHLQRCVRRNEKPRLTAQQCTAIEEYVHAPLRVSEPRDPGLRELWLMKTVVTPPENLPLKGAERYISIDRIQAHTYADALESLGRLSFAVNPSYVSQIGELEQARRQRRTVEISTRAVCIVPSSRVKSVEVIQTWIDREIGLTERMNILIPGKSTSIVAFRLPDGQSSPDGQSPDGQSILEQLLSRPYVTVHRSGTAAAPMTNAVRSRPFFHEGREYMIESTSVSDLYDAVIRRVDEFQIDCCINVYGGVLPALYHEELVEQTSRYHRSEGERENQERNLRAQIEQETRCNEEIRKANATIAELADQLENDMDLTVAKAAELKSKLDAAKATLDAQGKKLVSVLNTQARIRSWLATTISTQIIDAARISKYLRDSNKEPPSPAVLAAKYKIPENSSWSVEILRKDPAFGQSLTHPAILEYLRRFTEGLAPSMIPDKCQLFFPNQTYLHHAGKYVDIYSRFDGNLLRQSGPDYMGILLKNVAAGSQMRQFTIIKDDIGHMAEIVALKRELHSLDEINATIRPTTPNAQGLWTVSDDTISRALQSCTSIVKKVDSVRNSGDSYGPLSSDIVKTANVLYDKIQRAITLLRAFGDRRSGYADIGRRHNNQVQWQSNTAGLMKSASELVELFSLAERSGAHRIRSVSAQMISPQTHAPRDFPERSILTRIISQIENARLSDKKRKSSEYARVINMLRILLSDYEFAASETHIGTPASINEASLIETASSIGVNLQTSLPPVLDWYSDAVGDVKSAIQQFNEKSECLLAGIAILEQYLEGPESESGETATATAIATATATLSIILPQQLNPEHSEVVAEALMMAIHFNHIDPDADIPTIHQHLDMEPDPVDVGDALTDPSSYALLLGDLEHAYATVEQCLKNLEYSIFAHTRALLSIPGARNSSVVPPEWKCEICKSGEVGLGMFIELRCGHVYHSQCIDKRRSSTCVTCDTLPSPKKKSGRGRGKVLRLDDLDAAASDELKYELSKEKLTTLYVIRKYPEMLDGILTSSVASLHPQAEEILAAFFYQIRMQNGPSGSISRSRAYPDEIVGYAIQFEQELDSLL